MARRGTDGRAAADGAADTDWVAGDRLLPLARIGSDQINDPSGNRQSGAVARSHARVFCRGPALDARALR